MNALAERFLGALVSHALGLSPTMELAAWNGKATMVSTLRRGFDVKWPVVSGSALLLAGLSCALYAHHSFAIYDIDNKIQRSGILTEFAFSQPHNGHPRGSASAQSSGERSRGHHQARVVSVSGTGPVQHGGVKPPTRQPISDRRPGPPGPWFQFLDGDLSVVGELILAKPDGSRIPEEMEGEDDLIDLGEGIRSQVAGQS